MKKMAWVILSLFLIALVPPAMGEEFTISVNGMDYQSLNNPSFTWGDTITFSGTYRITDEDRAKYGDALASEPNVYINILDPYGDLPNRIPDACKGLSPGTAYPISVDSNNGWTYTWDSGNLVCKYPLYSDTRLTVSSMGVEFPITMKGKITPTPTPTEDYGAKIAALESKVAEQNSTIATLSTVAARKTVNYTERLEAIERNASEQRAKIEEQEDWIQQIMVFLGLA